MTRTAQLTDDEVARHYDRLEAFRHAVGRVLVGQHALVDRLLIGLCANGHLLLEGPPGVAKTLAVRAAAAALHLPFKRIQFTPDLLPADLIGTEVYNPRTGEFSIKKGPLFASIILADEVNRAPAKVQSALLEAMQERQVTIGEQTHPLPDPFLVLATQNPLEHEGTYPLPEAQLDRFLLKVVLGYPDREEELMVLDRMAAVEPDLSVEPVLGVDDIHDLRRAVDRVHLDARVRDYLLNVVRATRTPATVDESLAGAVEYGASPRAAVFLARAARAAALLEKRGYVTPQDVKGLARDALRHRLVLSIEAEADGLSADAVLDRLLDRLPVP